MSEAKRDRTGSQRLGAVRLDDRALAYLHQAADIRQISDGTFVPACDGCGYEGKPQRSRARAVAALLQHKGSRQHRASLALGQRRRTSPALGRTPSPQRPSAAVPGSGVTAEAVIRALRAASEELGGASPTSSWWQQSGRRPRYDQIVRVAPGGWAEALALAGLPPVPRARSGRATQPLSSGHSAAPTPAKHRQPLRVVDRSPVLGSTTESVVFALRAAAEELGGASPTSSWWQQSGRKPRYEEIVRIAGGGWADALDLAGLPPVRRRAARSQDHPGRTIHAPKPLLPQGRSTAADALIELLRQGSGTPSEDERAANTATATHQPERRGAPTHSAAPNSPGTPTPTMTSSFCNGAPINTVPLGKLRAMAVDAIRDGATSQDDVSYAIEQKLGMSQQLSPAHEREVRRLVSSAITHRWVAVNEDGQLSYVCAPCAEQTDGQLMRHSFGAIAHAINTMVDTNDELADVVVAKLGYARPAGRTARKIVAHIAQDWSSSL